MVGDEAQTAAGTESIQPAGATDRTPLNRSLADLSPAALLESAAEIEAQGRLQAGMWDEISRRILASHRYRRAQGSAGGVPGPQ